MNDTIYQVHSRFDSHADSISIMQDCDGVHVITFNKDGKSLFEFRRQADLIKGDTITIKGIDVKTSTSLVFT